MTELESIVRDNGRGKGQQAHRCSNWVELSEIGWVGLDELEVDSPGKPDSGGHFPGSDLGIGVRLDPDFPVWLELEKNAIYFRWWNTLEKWKKNRSIG